MLFVEVTPRAAVQIERAAAWWAENRPAVPDAIRVDFEEAKVLLAHQARQEAGLTQAQLPERMGTQAPAVACLERALASGKHSPSVATVRKYVKACGKRLVLQVA